MNRLKVLGLILTFLSFAGTLLSNYVEDKKLDEKVEEKFNERFGPEEQDEEDEEEES